MDMLPDPAEMSTRDALSWWALAAPGPDEQLPGQMQALVDILRAGRPGRPRREATPRRDWRELLEQADACLTAEPGLSQAELARRLGCSRNQLHYWRRRLGAAGEQL